MDLALAAVALAPGLALGSFLNVVAARVPLHRSLVWPGSACMSCGHEIAWYDNIPLVSWLALRGRCRSCGERIPYRYPLVELVTALLVAVSAIDLEHLIIPNRIVLPAAAVVLAANTALHPSPEWIIGAVGASGFLFAAALAYPRGMGMGDVKLALLMGAMLGRTVPVALMVGMLAAIVPGIVLIARHGSAGRKMRIPFGPFLALGAVVALFAGPAILHVYWGIGRS